MGVSKVIYGDQTLIDLTNDTVRSDNLIYGNTAHGSDGSVVNGAIKVGSKAVTAGTSNVTVLPDAGYDLMDAVLVRPTPSQTKYVNAPANTSVDVTPDSGYLLDKVHVYPYRLQRKTVTAGTSNVTVSADTSSGYDALEYVIVQPTPSSSITLTPDEQTQSVLPLSGELFSGVTVNPIPSQYVVPSGNKELSYTTNGTTSNIDVRNYETVSVRRATYLTEETLWTNSSPTSSFVGDITVSNYSGYRYVRIYFRYSTSLNETSDILVQPSALYNNYVGFGMRKSNSSTINDMRYRCCRGTSYTVINFANSVAHQSSSQTTSGAYIIPTKITGIKLS